MISQNIMLGDWVMLNPDLKEYYQFAGKPCMVIGLHDDDGAIKIEYDNGKYFWTDAEDDVIAIPLTAEILEANGFENFGNRCSIWLNREDFDNHTEINYRIDQNWIDLKRMADRLYICQIKCEAHYVHELQHLLRAAGLNDMADNFKIKKGANQ